MFQKILKNFWNKIEAGFDTGINLKQSMQLTLHQQDYYH